MKPPLKFVTYFVEFIGFMVFRNKEFLRFLKQWTVA